MCRALRVMAGGPYRDFVWIATVAAPRPLPPFRIMRDGGSYLVNTGRSTFEQLAAEVRSTEEIHKRMRAVQLTDGLTILGKKIGDLRA